jgi:hypothetical protein
MSAIYRGGQDTMNFCLQRYIILQDVLSTELCIGCFGHVIRVLVVNVVYSNYKRGIILPCR